MGSKVASSGIERDYRNNQPDGPELDRREDEFPTVFHNPSMPKEESHFNPASIRPKKKRVLGLRKTTFWLSLALALGLVLAAVAAGIAGSLAKSRSCGADRNPTTPLGSSNSTSNSTCTNSSQGNTNTNNTTIAPTTDCTSITSPYNALNGDHFDLHCKTDYTNGDIMGVLVNTFEICIEACASYNARAKLHANSTCSAVSYSPALDFKFGGNCWLKAAGQTISGTKSDRTSSATLSTVS